MGSFNKLIDQMEENFKLEFPVKGTIFTSVKEYVDANNIVGDLQFYKFKAFFYLYVLLTTLFSCVRLLFALRPLAYRCYRKLKSNLNFLHFC